MEHYGYPLDSPMTELGRGCPYLTAIRREWQCRRGFNPGLR